MASPGFGLASPTGANQYSDTNYALPSLGQSASEMLRMGNTGYEMFASPTSSVGTGTPTTSTPPGVVPPQSLPISTTPASPQGQGTGAPQSPTNPIGEMGGVKNVGSGAETVTTLYPDYTQQYGNLLQSLLGKGTTPFNLSALLPS